MIVIQDIVADGGWGGGGGGGGGTFNPSCTRIPGPYNVIFLDLKPLGCINGHTTEG